MAAMIHLQCPSCKQNLEVADYLAGLPIVCKFCSASVPVPAKLNLSGSGQSKLAERLAFIQKEPAQSEVSGQKSEVRDQPRSVVARALATGVGLILVAGIVGLIVFLNQENEKKPEKEIVQNKPIDPKPGPVDYQPPPDKQL